ncbi:hypothetical protein RRG08_046635 [Elysia crispata]|uniref:ATP-binding cassette sub-family B member 10, mitochondrial n=1 Tax=Elysia crispata TaxID=231223 RepID=A0AAE1AQY5_9GAST|nr:hypothetical protein RRG08_046635 [Elysia crispata]
MRVRESIVDRNNYGKREVKQSGSSKPVVAIPKKKDVQRLISLAAPEKWSLTGAIGCLIVSSAVTMTVPFCIGKIIDLIHASDKEHMMSQLNQVCSVLLGMFVLGGLANFGRVYILQTASQRIVRRLRGTLFNSIMRQEVGFFDKTKTGELINRLSSDTTVVASSLSQNISDGLRALFQVTAGIGMMTFVSAKLALISLGIVPPVAIGSIIYGRYLRKITKQVQDSLANATQVAEERIATIRTVRAFAHERKECEAYSEGIERVLKLSYKESLARGFFWGFTGFSGNVIVISVFYFGGLMMLESNMTVGDLSSFLLYATYVGVALGGLTSFYTEMNRGIAASHRIWQLIDRQPSIEMDHVNKPAITLPSIQGNMSFKDVYFSYPSRKDMSIFSNLSLEIPAGLVTAVVGPSGSGKSTLSSLLLRFYDPQEGQVCLDGVDICQLDPSWLRSKIGTVSQEPILFSTTIANNIAYGSEKPDEVQIDQIIDAAKKANAYNFVSNFPDGFNTLVGERGLMLSGGQRQRIAIARAILKDPKILILDEATSALDAESEYLVQEALERLMVGRTVLTIAHRLSTIKSASKIIVIDEGKVVENGTYQGLLSLKDGLFRKLVERQTIVK